MNLINAALSIIEGSVTVVRETNNMKYLSNGQQFNKKELNKFLTVLNCYAYHQRDKNPEVQVLNKRIANLTRERLGVLATTEQLLNAKVHELGVTEKFLAAYPEEKEEKPAKIVSREWLVEPRATNKRFICGYSYRADGEPEFVMVFWNNSKEISNSHGDLEQYYKKHHDEDFQAKSGGFFLTRGHNNSTYFGKDTKDNVYLFGRSDTFGSFYHDIEEIRKYGDKIKVNFIIGKTQFEIGERNDIIAENFTDHIG